MELCNLIPISQGNVNELDPSRGPYKLTKALSDLVALYSSRVDENCSFPESKVVEIDFLCQRPAFDSIFKKWKNTI